jgi:hypothetical protein
VEFVAWEWSVFLYSRNARELKTEKLCVPGFPSKCKTQVRLSETAHLRTFKSAILLGKVARPARLERATLCLEGRRSIQLSYGRNLDYWLILLRLQVDFEPQLLAVEPGNEWSQSHCPRMFQECRRKMRV